MYCTEYHVSFYNEAFNLSEWHEHSYGANGFDCQTTTLETDHYIQTNFF